MPAVSSHDVRAGLHHALDLLVCISDDHSISVVAATFSPVRLRCGSAVLSVSLWQQHPDPFVPFALLPIFSSRLQHLFVPDTSFLCVPARSHHHSLICHLNLTRGRSPLLTPEVSERSCAWLKAVGPSMALPRKRTMGGRDVF